MAPSTRTLKFSARDLRRSIPWLPGSLSALPNSGYPDATQHSLSRRTSGPGSPWVGLVHRVSSKGLSASAHSHFPQVARRDPVLHVLQTHRLHSPTQSKPGTPATSAPGSGRRQKGSGPSLRQTAPCAHAQVRLLAGQSFQEADPLSQDHAPAEEQSQNRQ